jgi:hypothetical protein
MAGYATSTGNRTTNDGTWTYTFDDGRVAVCRVLRACLFRLHTRSFQASPDRSAIRRVGLNDKARNDHIDRSRGCIHIGRWDRSCG